MHIHSKFKYENLSGTVYCIPNGYLIRGQTNQQSVEYRAANPPDYHLGVAGTALPFANQTMAFNPSVNCGSVIVDGQGTFEIQLQFPNSYYTCNGRELIPPSVVLMVGGKTYSIALNTGYKNRSLKALPGRPDRTYDR